MKLEKLLTLSQFVDMLDQSTVTEMTEMLGSKYHTMIPITIFNYNKFLKQPLTKEMFINPYGDAIKGFNTTMMTVDAIERKSNTIINAEKKVIFEDWINYEEKGKRFDLINTKSMNYGIAFFHNGDKVMQKTITNTSMRIQTLHDLVEATNGELTLKNVNI